MKKILVLITIIVVAMLVMRSINPTTTLRQVDQIPEPQVIEAIISYRDKPPLAVTDIRMRATFAPSTPGYHSYDPLLYYNVSVVYGERQRIPFASLEKVIFSKVKRDERRYIPEQMRNHPVYAAQQIDKNGYITVNATRILASMTTKDGKVLEDIILEPDQARIALQGHTVFGDYDFPLYSIEEQLAVEFIQQSR